jgi:AraC-like DNA-binding protein
MEAPPLVSRRGSVLVERTVRRGPDGAVRLVQRFRGDGVRVLVTHEASLTAEVEVLEGTVTFPLAGREVEAPRRFTLEVPPRSVLQIRFRRAHLESDGTGRFGAPRRRPSIDGGAGRLELDADLDVPARIALARGALHEHLGDLAPVRAASAAAAMDADVLARGFVRAYGLLPKAYCHRARLFDAAIRLYEGLSIADAALASGFNDLSRFYRQFRRILGSTPGAYHLAAVGKRRDAVTRAP